jgi:hypothetical protein
MGFSYSENKRVAGNLGTQGITSIGTTFLATGPALGTAGWDGRKDGVALHRAWIVTKHQYRHKLKKRRNPHLGVAQW